VHESMPACTRPIYVCAPQYLAMVAKDVALLEPSCAAVSLQAEPDAACHLRLEPYTKTRSIGQPMQVWR
jgi:hypothetical protein